MWGNSVRGLIAMEMLAGVTNDSRSINPSNTIMLINRSFRQTTQEDKNTYLHYAYQG